MNVFIYVYVPICGYFYAETMQAPSFLSYALYSLSRGDLMPSSQLKLLYLLPSLACDQHTAPLVGGCIASLSSTPQLRPVATRLMGQAWKLQVSHSF